MITRVRVPSLWTENFERRNATAEFGLGLGPCGKNVTSITVDFETAGVMVTQWCYEDDEKKVFFYPWHTVTGRVEVTYG